MESNSDLAGRRWGRLANETGKPGVETSSSQVAGEQEPGSGGHRAVGGGQLWARRLGLLVFVLFCLELGIVLVVLPWTRIWIDNNLLLNYPTLRLWAANTFVRGAFSGLGLIDIGLGIWEVVRYRENTSN